MEATMRPVAVSDLRVDYSYQRPRNWPRGRKMAREWDWALYEPITVSEREDSSLWIIEGQTRWTAAGVREFEKLMARVFTGLTVEQEAAIFRGINSGRKAVTPVEGFHAAVREGREPEISIKREMDARGLHVGEGTGHRIPGYGALRAQVDKYGLNKTFLAVDVCAQAWGPQSTSFHASILRAVSALVGENDLIKIDHLIETLETRSPERWRSDAGAYKGEGDTGTASVAVRREIARAYNKGKKTGSRFKIK